LFNALNKSAEENPLQFSASWLNTYALE